MNSKDILIYFMKVYEKEYGKKYVPSWGREMKIIKSKIVGNFDDEVIVKCINKAVNDYPVRWATKQYPVPTVGSVCTWIWNVVINEIDTDTDVPVTKAYNNYKKFDSLF